MADETGSAPSADDVWAVRDTPLGSPAPQGFPPAGFMSATGAPGGGIRNGMGTAGLVLGIIALVLFWTVVLGLLLGVLGLVFGCIGRSRAKRGEANNGGAALAGIITSVLALLGAIVVIVLAITVFGGPAKNLSTCLKSAGNDTSAQQVCDDQFRQQIGG